MRSYFTGMPVNEGSDLKVTSSGMSCFRQVILATTGLGGGGFGKVFVHKNVTTLQQCDCHPGAWQGHRRADSAHCPFPLTSPAQPVILHPEATLLLGSGSSWRDLEGLE